jgi:hypothetical protein
VLTSSPSQQLSVRESFTALCSTPNGSLTNFFPIPPLMKWKRRSGGKGSLAVCVAVWICTRGRSRPSRAGVIQVWAEAFPDKGDINERGVACGFIEQELHRWLWVFQARRPMAPGHVPTYKTVTMGFIRGDLGCHTSTISDCHPLVAFRSYDRHGRARSREGEGSFPIIHERDVRKCISTDINYRQC